MYMKYLVNTPSTSMATMCNIQGELILWLEQDQQMSKISLDTIYYLIFTYTIYEYLSSIRWNTFAVGTTEVFVPNPVYCCSQVNNI